MSKVSMDSHGNSFEEIIREVGKSIQCERIYIFEKNTDNTYDCTLEWCENPKDARKESMQHLKYECVRYYYKYFAEKKNLVIKNMDDLREENPKLYLILSPQQLHSVMAVQLKYGDEDLGFMGIDNPPVDKIEDYEPVLELVAYLISNLIKSRQTIELLNKMGYQDRLTGCGTRYSLFHDVDQLEMGTELCIIYADVMGLKKLNDTKGHDAGDVLLRKMSEGLQKYFDKTSVYRLGGDEFLVLKKNITREKMEELLEKSRKDLESQGVHFAAGLVVCENYREDIQRYIREADGLMYQEKKEKYRLSGRR